MHRDDCSKDLRIRKTLYIIFIVFGTLNSFSFASTQTSHIENKTNWFISDLKPESIFIDLSYLNDAPAGKHGYVNANGEKLVFENGEEIKFWGVALSAGACFPDKKHAPAIARRLAALGFNLVRFHHMDAAWAGRSLIDYSKNDSRHFNYKNRDRLDYLIKALKDNGIYIYLDLLVSRQFKELDGINNASTLPYQGKGATIIHPQMIELQKEYAKSLWNHINPYTGLRYREDPCFAFTLITNENDITSHFFLTPDNTLAHPELANLFKQRLNEYAIINKQNKHKTNKVWETVEGRKATNAIMVSYFKDMYEYLRKIGVKTLITGTNWAMNLHDLPALSIMDFMDQHIYAEGNIDDLDLLNSPLKKSNSVQRASFARLKGKPFVVSEWNKDYPKAFRAEYPLSFAAIAAFQNWNAAVLYCYSHDSWTHQYLHHPNDTIIDPARITLMPAAALIFRNGVKPSENNAVISISKTDIFKDTYRPKEMMAYRTGIWQKRLSLSWKEDGIDPEHNFLGTETTHISSNDNQLYWDWNKGYRIINTPIVQAVIGKGGTGSLKTSDVTFAIDNQFYAIVVASADGTTPINSARKLWIMSAARAKNSGSVINEDNTGLSNNGNEPILVEKITGNLYIKNNAKSLKNRVINSDGTTITNNKMIKDPEGFWVLPLKAKEASNIYEIFE